MRILIFFWIALIALCAQPVGGNAQQKRDPVVIGPERSNCSDILDLQKLTYDPEQNVIRLDYLHPQRGAIYMAVVGWLQGFFSAQNLFDLSIDSDFTKGTKSLDWMNWMFQLLPRAPERHPLRRGHRVIELAEADLSGIKTER